MLDLPPFPLKASPSRFLACSYMSVQYFLPACSAMQQELLCRSQVCCPRAAPTVAIEDMENAPVQIKRLDRLHKLLYSMHGYQHRPSSSLCFLWNSYLCDDKLPEGQCEHASGLVLLAWLYSAAQGWQGHCSEHVLVFHALALLDKAGTSAALLQAA